MKSCQRVTCIASANAREAKPLLSLARCRQILGNASPESDADLERLRDQLYTLARATVEALPHQRREKAPALPLNHAGRVFKDRVGERPPASFSDALALLPQGERYELEERAAIHEFDGHLDRSAAELAAFSTFWREKHQSK